MGTRFSGSTGTGQPEKTGATARNREKPELFNRNRPQNSRFNREKPELFTRNRPENSRFNREKPELEKTGAFQPEPPGKFPVEPEKPAQIFRISASTGAHP